MRRFIRLILGINIYAITINLLQNLNLGLGSFDSLTQEVQNMMGLTEFGNASFILHFLFFLLLILLAKVYDIEYKYILLSLGSIFILTRFVNFYSLFYFNVNQSLMSITLIILVLNAGLYLIASTNLIIAPFDKFVVESSKFFKLSLGTSRVLCDLSLLIIVIVINALLTTKIEITLFTFLITFGTGINMGIYEFIEKKYFKN